MNTCRICGSWFLEGRGPMIKYGPRHYAHADCALKKWGNKFFDKLTPWQLENFPALVASRFDLLAELRQRIESRNTEQV